MSRSSTVHHATREPFAISRKGRKTNIGEPPADQYAFNRQAVDQFVAVAVATEACNHSIKSSFAGTADARLISEPSGFTRTIVGTP